MYQVVIEKSNKKQKMKKVELPSIDISALTNNDARKRTVADELIEAFEEIGFAVLVGHGIEKKRLSEMRELLINVFSIPDSVKEELSISRSNYRGYIPFGFFSPNEKKIFGKTKNDLYEGFKLHWECPKEHPVKNECKLYGSNKWVKEVENMEETLLSYWEDCDLLTSILLSHLAIALGVKPDILLDFFNEPLTNMTLLHYPVSSTESQRSGIHPHKDISAITILHPDPLGGLEIQTRKGEWLEIFCPPDALLVNIGDLMEVWSGGRFISTPHRVLNRNQASRYSAPYFSVPRYSTLVKSLVEHENNFKPREILVGEVSAEVWRTNWPDQISLQSSYQLGSIN